MTVSVAYIAFGKNQDRMSLINNCGFKM